MNFKRILAAFVLAFMLAGVMLSLASCDDKYEIEEPDYIEIAVKDYGVITVKLDWNNAPRTCKNFVNLANEGFYDGLTFHRIIENFMIQGGDPKANGSGGSPNKIFGEFSENGHRNRLSHKRGVISMARSDAYNSASSQFFICNADSTYLDGSYAAFGYVTEGMDIVDRVTADFVGFTTGGVIKDKAKQPVIEYIRVVQSDQQ